MKIGIVSMQEIINYGSFLQAYALLRLLNSEEVSFISIYSQSDEKSLSICKRILREIKFLWAKKKKYIETKISRRQLKENIIPFQRKYFQYKQGEFDLLVVGSDEVFNFAQEASWDSDIFLGKGIDYKRICSFAASCGFTTVDMLTDEEKKKIGKYLGQFESVSVRDEGTGSFVRNLCDKEIQYTLDPVLLYDFEKEMIENPTKYSGDYMVVYSYNYRFSNEHEIKEIKNFAKKYKLKIIAVEGVQEWTDEYVAVNPFELFNLFKNAKYIVTDTFHGTIIASKLHKNFATFVRESNANKLEDLIKRLSIEKHKYVRGNLEKVLLNPDDYCRYECILKDARAEAANYINEIKSGL